MKKRQPTIDEAISRLEGHLLRRFPALKLRAVKDSDLTATIWFESEADEDWFAVIERAGPLATDILVDSGYWIHVQPRIKEPAS